MKTTGNRSKKKVWSCFLKMKFSLVSLMLLFCCCYSSWTQAAEEDNRLERIEACGTKCSQSLSCRMKSHFIFPPPCQSPPKDFNTSSLFQNMSLSTVMKCEGRQRCSLHLRIHSRLLLREPIRGLSICTASPGLMGNCGVIGFTEDSRDKLSGSEVEIENDCTTISPSQEVQITVKTFPAFCDTHWTGVYHAPGCIHKDLRSHVPECITGKLSYKVNEEKKEFNVNVTDMLEGHNYNLRLCRAKEYICEGTGTRKIQVIKKDEPVKSVTLSYSRPLPCLCIEGWSAVPDALRIQVCPFKKRVEELWSEITYKPSEALLSWQPLCPVTAVITLCQIQEDGVCTDLPQTSRNVTRKMVQFTGVDPHPQLCMKFSADSQHWIRCPFADGPGWELVVSGHPEEVRLLTPTAGTFFVELCEKSNTCNTKEIRTFTVEKHGFVDINIPKELQQISFCVQVNRLDMTYSATLIHCVDKPSSHSFDPTWIVVLTGVLLALILLTTLVLQIWITVNRRRVQKGKEEHCLYKKHQDCVSNCRALQSEAAPVGGVFVPDSPQCRSNEKAILLPD